MAAMAGRRLPRTAIGKYAAASASKSRTTQGERAELPVSRPRIPVLDRSNRLELRLSRTHIYLKKVEAKAFQVVPHRVEGEACRQGLSSTLWPAAAVDNVDPLKEATQATIGSVYGIAALLANSLQPRGRVQTIQAGKPPAAVPQQQDNKCPAAR